MGKEPSWSVEKINNLSKVLANCININATNLGGDKLRLSRNIWVETQSILSSISISLSFKLIIIQIRNMKTKEVNE